MFQQPRLSINISETETLICKWKENNDTKDLEPTIKFQHMELINIKYIKYLRLWISYNTFTIEHKKAEQIVGCPTEHYTTKTKYCTDNLNQVLK